MNQPAQKQWIKYLVCLLLAGITGAAFASVAQHAFIAFDDRDYIVGNWNVQQGFSWPMIKWAFTTFHSNNWHPLTWLSHMLDYHFFGLDPAGPHLVNLAFHITNAVLLFLFFQNITARLWPSALVALLFAIHPLHVESVAWASERKDVLSTFFFLLTILTYARYVELANAKKSLCWGVYGLGLFFFALGLMSKPMLVTLPGVLFLLDFWPLRRFQLPLKGQPKAVWYRLVIEKIPFIILVALSCWVTFVAQKTTGAVKTETDFSLVQRLAQVSVSYAWYLLKLFYPLDLSVFYPLRIEQINNSTGNVLGASLLFLGLTAFAIVRARKNPYFLVGWLWLVGTLVPVIGLVQVGNQSYADRYTYIPYIGLFIIVVWGASDLLAGWPHRRPFLAAAALLVSASCFWRTVVEVHYWKDGPTLFKRAIALNPENEMPWLLLGLEYEVHGDNEKAIESVTRATELNNEFNLAWYNLGHMLVVKGDYAGAINAYQTALACYSYQGKRIELYNDLGDVYTTTGQYSQAIANYQNSLALSPDQPDIQYKLAPCLAKNGQPDQAIDIYENILHSHPDHLETQLNLAILLADSGRDAEAIAHYQKVIELDTNLPIALNNLAWMRATDSDPGLRNGKEAVALAEHACERTHYQEAFLIGTLAAAYAEAGRFEDAVAAAQKAQDVASAHGQKEIAEKNAELMKLYQSGQPLHMKATPPPKPSS